MHRTSPFQQAATAVAGATAVLIFTVTQAAAHPSAAAPSPTGFTSSPGTCRYKVMVFRPLPARPTTPKERADFQAQHTKIDQAILCLVNEARREAKLSKLERPVAIPGGRPGLGAAAAGHARDAVRLRWWGTVAQVRNCTPSEDDPSRCDTHINPSTKLTPTARAQANGYTRGCRSYRVGENTHTGWGHPRHVTPQAAFNAWMQSPPHRANILKPEFNEMRTAVAWGSADPAAGSATPALTYVQMFGTCTR
jgi:uncharacterized protein YkwD